MAPDTSTNSPNPTPKIEPIPKGENAAPTPTETLVNSREEERATPTTEHKKNIYSTGRHLLLICCILFGLCLIIFLVHQNGKSIYENGL